MMGAGYLHGEAPTDWFKRATIENRRSLWPRRCEITGRSLWLKRSVRATRVYTGPGDPVVEQRWFEPNAVIFLFLKGR
jgi:hypothetical protein